MLNSIPEVGDEEKPTEVVEPVGSAQMPIRPQSQPHPHHQSLPLSQYLLPVKMASDRYRVVGFVGSGSFGSVSIAKLRTGTREILRQELSMYPRTLLEPIPRYKRPQGDLVAIKVMDERLSCLEHYSHVKEVKFILSLPSHANLVQLYDLFVDRLSFKLHIVMETMDQNLYQVLKARRGCVFSPRTLKSVLAQLLAALRHIHRCQFFHRDVKPENILVTPAVNFYGCVQSIPPDRRKDPYVIKLADYGLARHVGNTRPVTSYVSTRWYRAPEILLRKKHYYCPVDMWAFGCVAVEAARFSPLFPGENELDQTWRVLEALGSPDVKRRKTPLGGYWEEAQPLASKLGFRLPDVRGTTMSRLIPRSDIHRSERYQLYDFIKACLTWDPEKRITSELLAQFPYFDGTTIRDEDEAAVRMQQDYLTLLSPFQPAETPLVPLASQLGQEEGMWKEKTEVPAAAVRVAAPLAPSAPSSHGSLPSLEAVKEDAGVADEPEDLEEDHLAHTTLQLIDGPVVQNQQTDPAAAHHKTGVVQNKNMVDELTFLGNDENAEVSYNWTSQ